MVGYILLCSLNSKFAGEQGKEPSLTYETRRTCSTGLTNIKAITVSGVATGYLQVAITRAPKIPGSTID